MEKSARYRPPRYTTITSGRSPGSRVISKLTWCKCLWGESPSHVIRHSGRMIHFNSTTVAGAASELINHVMVNRTDFSFHFTKLIFGSAPEAVKVAQL